MHNPENSKQQPPLTPPDAPEQPEVVSTETQSQPQDQSQTDVLGIVSIVLAFVTPPPIGLIIAIIGMSKAKKDGYANTLSKIGLIINGVILGIILLYVAFFMVFFGLAALSN